MISFAKFEKGYNADMDNMCEECIDDNCRHHGGPEPPCDKYRSASDAYEDYGAEQAEWEREERLLNERAAGML